MKIKNNQSMSILFFFILLSCKGKADNIASLTKTDNTDSVKKHSPTLINDSFSYQVITEYEKSENGLYTTKGDELIIDSSYIHYFKLLTTDEILKLLKSEEFDFGTDVILLKLYKDFVPTDLLKRDSNQIQKWKKETNKERLTGYWQEELLKRNHDSLRLIYLKNNG